ncbi:EAL domain-containing protein [Thermotoga sp. KOL6]|uniref:EAL domain-containing protein n=1 Tax=Thermotoga sp. KOL6 TaxID=126741 RepID=UPI000CC1A659|nr:EAL domain-containing protein [Thermotoga sp. KOL6]PLV59779.1 hypothetical protein AS005_00300 [Thermotoga sp. KOL6]
MKDAKAECCGSLIPEIPSGKLKVVVFTQWKEYKHYLLSKFKEIFHDSICVNVTENYLIFEADFLEFLDVALVSRDFTPEELRRIMILPLSRDESFTLDSLGKMRTFEYWLNLRRGKTLKFVLENESLVTFFQPIVDTETKEVVFYESLSRGINEGGNLIPPSELFSLAQKLDVNCHINRLSIKKAVESYYSLKFDKPLSINLPPDLLVDAKYIVEDIIKPPSPDLLKKIHLEITEAGELDFDEVIELVIKPLKEKGIKIAIDDVGKGYSSLNRIVKIRPDIVKIDLTLIRNIHQDRLKRYVVAALTSLCDKESIMVVAEGVETLEEFKTLKELGVRFMQGYLFAKPSPCPRDIRHPRMSLN